MIRPSAGACVHKHRIKLAACFQARRLKVRPETGLSLLECGWFTRQPVGHAEPRAVTISNTVLMSAGPLMRKACPNHPVGNSRWHLQHRFVGSLLAEKERLRLRRRPCSRRRCAPAVLLTRDGFAVDSPDVLRTYSATLAAQHARQCRALLPAVYSILLWQQRFRPPLHSTSCRAASEATLQPEVSRDPEDDQPDEAMEELPTSNVAEIASIQTPASVWLPSRGASGFSDKVSPQSGAPNQALLLDYPKRPQNRRLCLRLLLLPWCVASAATQIHLHPQSKACDTAHQTEHFQVPVSMRLCKKLWQSMAAIYCDLQNSCNADYAHANGNRCNTHAHVHDNPCPVLCCICSRARPPAWHSHMWLGGQVESKMSVSIGPAVLTLTGRLGRSAQLLLRVPQWLMTLLAFKSQQVMLASTMTKITAVFVVGIPLCLIGGLLYSWTSGKGLVSGFINAYGALYKIPGAAVHPAFVRHFKEYAATSLEVLVRIVRQVHLLRTAQLLQSHSACAQQRRLTGTKRLPPRADAVTCCPLSIAACACPGVTVIGEINQMTSHLMNILWLFGTFTFAIVLGVVTEDIVATVVVC